LSEVARTQPLLISDYSFAKDRLFAELNLPAPELRRYHKVYDLLAPAVPHPDAVVLLVADEAALLQRIARRGRSYEQQIAPDYLRRLAEAYHACYASEGALPVLRIDTTMVDIAHNASDQAVVLARIQAFVARLGHKA
jgi:deoxyguanosine kinase